LDSWCSVALVANCCSSPLVSEEVGFSPTSCCLVWLLRVWLLVVVCNFLLSLRFPGWPPFWTYLVRFGLSSGPGTCAWRWFVAWGVLGLCGPWASLGCPPLVPSLVCFPGVPYFDCLTVTSAGESWVLVLGSHLATDVGVRMVLLSARRLILS